MEWECHQCGARHPTIPERCAACGTAPEIVRNVWRCAHCGAEGNSGTVSTCPRCGAARQLGAETAISTHDRIDGRLGRELAGGLWRYCPYCDVQVPPVDGQSKPIEQCPTCAGPLQEATLAAQAELVSAEEATTYRKEAVRQLTVEGDSSVTPATDRNKKNTSRPRRRLALLLLAGLVGLALLWLLYRPETTLRVIERSWERRVAIERFGPLEKSAWQDQLPADARNRTCRRRIHHHDRIPAGSETYQAREQSGKRCATYGYITQGGVSLKKCTRWEPTYHTVTRQRPRYVQVPVYGQFCHFSVDAWQVVRTSVTKGGSDHPPTWPDLQHLSPGERAGRRSESYQLLLRDPSGHPHPYPCNRATWERFPLNSRVKARKRLGGKITHLLPDN